MSEENKVDGIIRVELGDKFGVGVIDFKNVKRKVLRAIRKSSTEDESIDAMDAFMINYLLNESGSAIFTIDALDDLSIYEYKDVVKKVIDAMNGQTEDIKKN